jgi:hypothetical protein
MSVIQTLSEYVYGVLDTNKDGRVNFRDFMELFPNSAIAIAMIFVDLVVLVAEYRVWDVGYKMTGDPYKAFGFVLVSAVPFYLGQVFWLYPVANTLQKVIAVGMVTSALYTSWVFGTADLTQAWNIPVLVSIVTDMTAGYIVAVLAYILFDNGIKAYRMKKQIEGQARQEKDYQEIVRGVLRELKKTQQLQKETEAEFNDPALVQAMLERTRGVKPKKGNEQPRNLPMQTVALNADTEHVKASDNGSREPDFPQAGKRNQ